MKRKKNKFLNPDESSNEISQNENYESDELLDLDELLSVEGGIEDDKGLKPCGLGCYTGGLVKGFSENEDHPQ